MIINDVICINCYVNRDHIVRTEMHRTYSPYHEPTILSRSSIVAELSVPHAAAQTTVRRSAKAKPARSDSDWVSTHLEIL